MENRDFFENRNLEDVLVDRLLLLFIVARLRKKGHNILGNIKLQKIIYKTQERMYLAKHKGLNYNFVRWDFGPFSQEIYTDVRDLKATGYLNPYDIASASEKGLELLKEYDEAFDAETINIVDRVINEFGPYNGKQIRAVMYSFPKVGTRKTIGETEKGELLLTRLNPKEAKTGIIINEKRMDTLRFLFDKKSNDALQAGINSLKTEECKPFNPVRRRQH